MIKKSEQTLTHFLKLSFILGILSLSFHWDSNFRKLENFSTTPLGAPPPPTTFSVRVNQGSDDAEEVVSSGSVNLTSSDLELVTDGSVQVVGVRFQNVTVPKNATILNAYIEFKADESQSESTSLIIKGQATDNAPTFSTSSKNISNRQRTTALVNWNNLQAWTKDNKYQTPNIKSIIQEIVNRNGWASGNNLAIIIDGTGHRTAESYEGNAPNAPLLVIEYSVGIGIEICDNGVDDDADGLIDNNDPDCGNCEQTIMLVARDGGQILQLNLSTGATSVATTSPYTSGNLNALAANADQQIVYYGRDQMVYYWNPITNVHGTLVNLIGQVGANESLTSGGCEYYNGYLYLGFENGNPGTYPNVYRLQLSTNGMSTIGSAVNLNIPIPTNTSWGDMVITNENGQAIIYGMTSTGSSVFWKYNIVTGVYTTINSSLGTAMQIGVDINGEMWAGSHCCGSIQKINRTDGTFYGASLSFGGYVWDLTGPINCPQAKEICDNGLDDDGDGMVDCADGECGGIPTVTISPTATTICAGQTTVLNASSTGGQAPMTYSWSNGLGTGSTKTVGPVSTTTYTVTVTSSTGCPATAQTTVTVNNPPSATVSPDATICTGTSTVISASASGGQGPYTFNWDNGLGTGATKTVSPVSSTTYTVIVSGANGCSVSKQVTVFVNPKPTANAGPDVTICKNFSTTITATATGGTTPYNYSWSNGLGNGASKVVSPMNTTTYTVSVTSPNGCISTDAVTVTVMICPEVCNNGKDDDGDGLADCADPDCGPTANAGPDASICAGNTAVLNASATGSTGSYTFAWSHGLGNGASKTVSPATTTVYTVTVTALTGCTATDQVTITVGTCYEDCTNGIDDDGDGLVDCADPDCSEVAAPVLADDTYSACPGIPYSDRVTYNDGNLQDPIFSISSQPTNGSVTIDATGKFVYTPFSTTCFTDSFVYQVCNQATGCCAEATVTLTIGDNLPPVILNVPADITIGCDDVVPSPPTVYAYDACPGIYIAYEQVSTQNDSSLCETYTITRTWTATDLCGNSSSASQTILVEDQADPEIFKVHTLPSGRKLLAGVAKRTSNYWKYVPFPITFGQTPLVFAQLTSENEIIPAIVKLRNITKQGFEMRIQEEEGADGNHLPENVSWLAIEPGSDNVADGFESGLFPNVTHAVKSLNLTSAFPETPGLIFAIQTNNETDPVTPRYQNANATSVEIFLQEETSAGAETAHDPETAGYLALPQGTFISDVKGTIIGESGTVSISNGWATVTLDHSYNKPAVIFGGISNQDTDPATIRVRNVTSNSFEVRVQEWAYLDGDHATETVTYLVLEGSIPHDTNYYCLDKTSDLVNGVTVFAADNCDHQAGLNYNESVVLLPTGLKTTRTWTATDYCGNTTTLLRQDTCVIAAVRLKAILYGATINNGGGTLMRDDLRQKSLIPTMEPYSTLSGYQHKGGGGGEVLDPYMLTIAGNNAIVDWVFVEIRDADDAKMVLASQSALIQRDGDVLSANGDSILYFTGLQEGSYHVVIRHRNHLGMMVNSPIFLNSLNPTFIDYSNLAEKMYGGSQAGRIFNANTTRALWAGDINGDRKVIYQGPSNDIFFLFSSVLSNSNNAAFLANFIGTGYHRHDVNMDGMVIYQGPTNDRGFLLYHTVMPHPGNLGFLANFIAVEKVP